MSDEDEEKTSFPTLEEMQTMIGEVPEDIITAKGVGDEFTVEAWCDETLAHDPGRCIALMYKADILYDRKEHDRAADYYSQAVMKAPFLHIAWEKIAMNYIRKHEYEAARRSLFSCVKMNAGSGWSWCLLALAYYMDDIPQGVEMTLKAGEVQALDKSTVLFMKGFLHERNGETDEAVFAYTASETYAQKEGKEASDSEFTRESIHRLLTQDG